jgi:hypothetical protein
VSDQVLHPHLLTPWSRVLLEKLTGLQLVKKFRWNKTVIELGVLNKILQPRKKDLLIGEAVRVT